METEAFFDENKEASLTEAQWEVVKNEWNSRPDNPPSISELTEKVTGQPGLDGRSRIGIAIKKKLYEANLKAPTSAFKAKGLLDLTLSQEEYIRNNYKLMSSLEMAESLFERPILSNLDRETRTVFNYVKTLKANDGSVEQDKEEENIPDGDYVAPRSPEGALKKINKYRHDPLEKEKLTGKQRKDINSLLGYMNTYRFNRQINTYGKNDDRELFESTFVRYCYDKFDLAEEEVDQYIMLATEVVIAATIQKRIESLNRLLDKSTSEEDKKISMSLVEAINTSQTEYNQCIGRQQKLLDSLKIKRSEKEGKDKGGAASIINLVQMWRDEESRKKMIKFAERKKENLKKGAEELMSMEELKCRLVGISMDEILNG